MHGTQRLVVEFILVLLVFALLSIVPTISGAEGVGAVANDCCLLGPDSGETPLPETVWSFCLAVTAAAAIVRRKQTD